MSCCTSCSHFTRLQTKVLEKVFFLQFQLRRIAEFRKEHERLVKTLLPSDEKKAFIEGNVVNVLTSKDHLGRRVLVVSTGKVWNPDDVKADQLFRLFYLSEFSDSRTFNLKLNIEHFLLVHLIAQLEKSSQINGVVVLMDFEGLSLKQVKALSPTYTKRLLTFIQEAMPIRLREVHFVKQPFIFNMVWTLFKPFVKEKLKNRVRGALEKFIMRFCNEFLTDVLPRRRHEETPQTHSQ